MLHRERKNKLITPTLEQTEANNGQPVLVPEPPGEVVLAGNTAPERPLVRRNGRGRKADGAGLASLEAELSGSAGEQPAKRKSAKGEDRQARRAARKGGSARPSAPRLGKASVPAGAPQALDPQGEPTEPEDASLADAEALLSLETGKKPSRTAARARRMQEAAAEAIDSMEANPALGALNRHLSLMTQQLTASQRVVGRIAAERDALRLQLAELQGVPVEQIMVTALGGPTEHENHHAAKAPAPVEQHTPTTMERLNYFGGDDLALMRKRRQTFVVVVAVVGGILGLIARSIGWSFPTDVSRDSLSALPFLGNLMTVFLAAWVVFRVIRVGGRGVRWVFPTEDRRRRRR